jgi:lipopolysaccharide transport system permease protein
MSKTNKVVIEPGAIEMTYWSDILRFKELFWVLAKRDIAVRYKQTVIGLLWSFLQPFLAMLAFTIIFGRVAKLPTEGAAPYALLVLSGLLPWQFFSTSLTNASSSLVGNSNLITKVYFPRLIVPTATILVAFVDLLISFLLLLMIMLWYQLIPSWQILSLPLFILMGFLASLGPSLLITSLNVKYRDFRYIIPFIVQFGMYISPVGFSSTVVPSEWRLFYSLNPMVGVIDGFRWAILGSEASIYLPGFIVSWVVILVFLWLGIRQFRKMEKNFADLI